MAALVLQSTDHRHLRCALVCSAVVHQLTWECHVGAVAGGGWCWPGCRCKVTTVNPDTAEAWGHEPLVTLGQFQVCQELQAGST